MKPLSHVYSGFLVDLQSLAERREYRLFGGRGVPRSGSAAFELLNTADTNMDREGRVDLCSIETVRCFVSLTGPVVDGWLARAALRLKVGSRIVQETPLLPIAREPLTLNRPLLADDKYHDRLDVSGEIYCRDTVADQRLADHLRGQPLSDLRARYPAMADAIDAQEAALDAARRLGADLTTESGRMWGWIFLSGEALAH